MRIYIRIITAILMLMPFYGFGQGLKFHSGNLPINERTSYSVFDRRSPVFRDYLEIEFDMQLYPVSEIGYILRIQNHNGNEIYNLFFDGRGDNFFKLNEEGRYTLITAKIDLPNLISKRWFKMRLDFDLKKDSIFFDIDGTRAGGCYAELPDAFRPEIVFGRSDYIIDVPSFSIKNLVINRSGRFSFPLRESVGNQVHNSKGVHLGSVINPDWLINDSYKWKLLAEFSSPSVAGVNYNPLRSEIYYYNRDTIWVYNVSKGTTDIMAFERRCPVDITLGMNFMDLSSRKLYTYEVYSGDSDEGTSVASLDLDNYTWRNESRDWLVNQLHHHSCFFIQDERQYTIFGGFGNMSYSPDFFTYSISDSTWHKVEGFSGDPLYPRYFSSMGYHEKDSSVFVFGGMGNESGEQAVGRRYFYDLYKIDWKTKEIDKLWEINWSGINCVPVREMIIPDDDHIYTLCYPESVSESHLSLYRFSIADGSFTIVGDSIPIRSDKIATNANFHYDKYSGELYATVQEFDDDIRSKLSIYSIAFPPITAKELETYSRSVNLVLVWIIIVSALVVLVSVGLFLRYRYIKRKRQIASISSQSEISKTVPSKPNSIFLFGDLQARNKENRNVTYMLSGKQEQTFLVILRHSFDGGITSRSLSAILWPDRPEDKAKNIRGVTINHLRKTLQEFDGVELVYSENRFSFTFKPPFYCDYIRCMEITSQDHLDNDDKEELLKIALRGKFIQFSTFPMYDSFKEDVDSKIEPILLVEMEKNFEKGEYHKVISFADALFKIDSINEKALSFQMKALKRLKLDDQAYVRYQTFITEYKKMMGDDYPTLFKTLY